jgi:hypothetical protein
MKRLIVFCLCGLVLSFTNIDSVSAQKESEKKVATPRTQKVKAKEIKLDRNYDGKIDRLEVYDEKGRVVRIEADTTGDGKMNEWIYFKDGVRSKAEKDVNGDGKVDSFLTYNEKGILIKSESDTTGDGKVDEWGHYKNGNIIKAEKDTNADGKPDTWIKY